MLTRSLIAIIASTTAALTAPVIVHAQGGQTMNTTANAIPPPTKTGPVEVKGVNYYYEIRGKGEPLLLLHGGLFSIDMFGPNLAILAAHHEVIAVDLQGHGRTTLGDRPISPIDMGDDMAAIVKQLGYRQVDALGYSLGGNVALRLAIQHPDAVRRLVLLSTPFAQDGFFPEMLPQQAAVGAAMAPMMKDTPISISNQSVHGTPTQTSGTQVEFVGRYSNVVYTAEHASGYELQLWRDGGSTSGLWFRTRGPASDFPVVSVTDLSWNATTGAFRFRARWCDEIQAFEGVLTNEILAGTLTTNWSSRAQESSAVTLKKSEYALDRMPRSEWKPFVDQMLKARGPNC